MGSEFGGALKIAFPESLRLLQHHMKWVELKIVIFIKPRAFEVIEAESRASRESECIESELFNGFFVFGIGFVIKDMNCSVSHLEGINVPGNGRLVV